MQDADSHSATSSEHFLLQRSNGNSAPFNHHTVFEMHKKDFMLTLSIENWLVLVVIVIGYMKTHTYLLVIKNQCDTKGTNTINKHILSKYCQFF